MSNGSEETTKKVVRKAEKVKQHKQPFFQRHYRYHKMKAFIKNGVRSISGHVGRFVAVFAIIALGAGVYAGLRMFVPDMYQSADTYYDEHNLVDYRITSTLGLTDKDVDAIRALPEIRGASGVHMAELAMESGDKSYEVSVEGINMGLARSYRPDDPQDDPNYVNHLILSEGRLPEKNDEIVISNTRKNIKLGQKLQVKTVIGFDAPEDFLAVKTFTVVGFATSPEFISDDYGISPQSGTTITNYGYVDNSAFKDPSVYTDIFATAKATRGEVAFSQQYKDAAESGRLAIKKLAPEREKLRRESIVDDAQKEIDDGQKKFDEGKAEADQKIADAENTIETGKKDLADARKKLADGQRQYQDGVSDLARKRAETEQKFADAQRQIDEGEEKLLHSMGQAQQAEKAIPGLEAKLSELKANKAQIEQGLGALDQLDDLKKKKAGLEAQKTQTQAQLTTLQGQLTQINAALAAITGTDPQSVAKKKALQAQKAQVEGGIAQAKAGLAQIEQALPQVSAGIAAIEAKGLDRAALKTQLSQVNGGIAQVTDGLAKAKAGVAQFNEGLSKVVDAKNELAAGKETAAREFAQAERDLAAAKRKLENGKNDIKDGEQKVADGEKELAEKKEEARIELAKNQKKLDDAREKLEDIPKAVWYILGRDANPGYATYKANAERMDQITTIFPIFFFLVAALVSLITMTRMVESERIEIGTLKALGYTRQKIASKYVSFALLASVFGSLFGIGLGVYILPKVIWMSYRAMYTGFPFLIEFHWKDSLIAAALSIGLTLLATASAARLTLREAPTTLMLPRAPKAGKRILLERITPLWKRMKFTSKVTARNLFRYKKRLIMTVMGVAGCTALLLTGFGIRDALSDFVPRHYYEINRFNETIGIDTKLDKEAITASPDSLAAEAMRKYAKGEWEFFSNTAAIAENPKGDPNGIPFGVGGEVGRTGGSMAAELRAAKSDAPDNATHEPGVLRDVTITVPHEGSLGDKTLETFYHLTDPKTGKQVKLMKDEVILTQKLAENLQVKPGDTIELSLGSDKPSHKAKIGGIAHYYIGHVIFMDEKTYLDIFGEAPEYNVILGKGPAEKSERAQIAEKLKESPAISSVTFPEDLAKSYENLTSSLGMLVALIIFVSGSLALIVMYNLTNINIEERRSEIATIKVLGFFDKEVDGYVFRETMFLSLLGTAVGLPLGVFLCTFIMRSAELDDVMFVRHIEPVSYILAVVITIIFTLLVMILMHRKLKSIDMVSSLKAVD